MQESSDSSKVFRSGCTIAERYLLEEQLQEGGTGTGAIYMDLQEMYKAKFRTSGKN